MIDDPERLLSEDSSADPQERALLRSLRSVSPPAGAKAQAWAGIAAQLGASAIAGAAAASSTAAAAKVGAGSLAPKALAAKAAWALAAGGVAVGGYLAAHAGFEPTAGGAPRSRERPPVVAHTPASPPPIPAAAIAPEPVQQQPEPQRRPLQHGAESKRRDRLSAESALLAEARAQLRAGNPSAARATLARLSARFPRGVLVQEREVLAIELLAAQGEPAAARQRARAFVGAYPNSPHSAKLGRYLDAP